MSRRFWRWGAYALVPVWLAGTIGGFWFFQGKYRQLYLSLEQPAEPLRIAPGRVTVVHLWDPGCICSRFNSGHVRDLVNKYRQHNVEFVVVPRENTDHTATIRDIRSRFGDVRVEPGWYARLSHYMPALPAAAVFDESGQARYVGPYSADLYCSGSSDGFVERALDQMLASGKQQQFITPIVSGCFCSTKQRAKLNRI